MSYCVPQELRNLKIADTTMTYRCTSVHGTVPVIDVPVMAMFRASNALKRVTGLNANWAELGAEPPNETAFQVANSVLTCTFMLGLEPTLVTASADSGIGICFRVGARYADIECFNTGEMTSTIVDGNSVIGSFEVMPQAGGLVAALQRINQTIHA